MTYRRRLLSADECVEAAEAAVEHLDDPRLQNAKSRFSDIQERLTELFTASIGAGELSAAASAELIGLDVSASRAYICELHELASDRPDVQLCLSEIIERFVREDAEFAESMALDN
jgi:hypothetical protein